VQAGMMQQWFRLVGGRVRAVMYWSSRLLSLPQTVLIFPAPVIANQTCLASSAMVGCRGVCVNHRCIDQSMSWF